MGRLTRFESWIEQMIEEPFVRLFAGRLLPQEVARHLARALEDGERLGADGLREIPGRYRIALNPADLEALQRDHPDLNAQFAGALTQLAEHMHIRLREEPVVILQADARMPVRSVRITPADRLPPAPEETRDLDIERLQQLLTHEEEKQPVAHLILAQEERTYDLTQQVVRLGRAFDNDIILEDRRVSRYHAQLRQRYGRYILQDLGSSGGTTVNGFPVQEIVLRPGDVISLSGTDLVYLESEETPRAEGHGSTRPIGPPRR